MGDSPFRPPPQDVTPRIFRKLQVTASPSCSFHQVRDALYCGVRPPLAQLPRCRTPRVLCGHVARVSARDGARAWRGRSSGPFSALSRVSDDSITGSNSCEARARATILSGRASSPPPPPDLIAAPHLPYTTQASGDEAPEGENTQRGCARKPTFSARRTSMGVGAGIPLFFRFVLH